MLYEVVCEGKPVPVKMDKLDLLSKFHLAVTVNYYANSAEGMKGFDCKSYTKIK